MLHQPPSQFIYIGKIRISVAKQTAMDAWTAPALNPLHPGHAPAAPLSLWSPSGSPLPLPWGREKALVEALPAAGFIPLFWCWEKAKSNCPLVPKDHISLAGVLKTSVWDT